MDYNSLKELPKDILIKLLFETEKITRKEWLKEIVEKSDVSDLRVCEKEDCCVTFSPDRSPTCYRCRNGDFYKLCHSHSKLFKCKICSDFQWFCKDCGCRCVHIEPQEKEACPCKCKNCS